MGDFYPSTGVTFKDIRMKRNRLIVEIEPEEGVTYLTEYIGTRKGFSTDSTPTLDEEGMVIPNTTRTYSEEIGEILYSSNEMTSSYTLSGDELYVRARVTASASQHDQISGEVIGQQRAWSQPYIP